MVVSSGLRRRPVIVWAAEPASKPGPIASGPESSTAIIKGQVRTIEPNSLCFGTDGGGQVRLKLTQDTKTERALKVGVRWTAVIGPDREAVNLSCRMAQKERWNRKKAWKENEDLPFPGHLHTEYNGTVYDCDSTGTGRGTYE